MSDFILELIKKIILEMINSVWFFIRPVVYLYLIYASIKIVTFFH